MSGHGDEPSDARNGPRSARSRPPRELRVDDEAQDDENFLFHLYRGSELLQDGREHEAKEELEKALLQKPGDQKGQDLLAAVYFRVGHFARAIAIYEQLQATSPNDPALQLNLALCYLKADKPELARGQLQSLLAASPEHLRAWGYLGLCHERLGELPEAQAAFEKSGHGHLARRVMERLAERVVAPAPPPTSASGETLPPPSGFREFVELTDRRPPAKEPSAEPPPSDALRRAVESARFYPPVPSPPAPLHTHPPSTREGPPPSPARPLAAASSVSGFVLDATHEPTPRSLEQRSPPEPPPAPTPEPPTRRKTLIVGPPPPTSSAEPLVPGSLRRPPSQRVPALDEPALSWSAGRLVSTPPGAAHAPSVFPPPSAAHFTKAAALITPGDSALTLHASGVVIARPSATTPFATRLESIRAMSGALDSKILERKQRGVACGETFGGLGSPLVELLGEGHLVVGPKPGHTLWTFTLDGAPCTAREDRVLGFQLSLLYDNERLALGATELRVVRFVGVGALVLETSSALVTLAVTPASPIVVRREVVVGWLGVLDITPVLPADAPGAHHGLVRFQGEGSVLASGL